MKASILISTLLLLAVAVLNSVPNLPSRPGALVASR